MRIGCGGDNTANSHTCNERGAHQASELNNKILALQLAIPEQCVRMEGYVYILTQEE